MSIKINYIHKIEKNKIFINDTTKTSLVELSNLNHGIHIEAYCNESYGWGFYPYDFNTQNYNELYDIGSPNWLDSSTIYNNKQGVQVYNDGWILQSDGNYEITASASPLIIRCMVNGNIVDSGVSNLTTQLQNMKMYDVVKTDCILAPNGCSDCQNNCQNNYKTDKSYNKCLDKCPTVYISNASFTLSLVNN